MINRILKDRYFQNISKLFASNSIAQIVSVLIIPLLSRLYTPEHFGVYGFFVASATLLSVVFNLKYDVALVFAKNNRRANDLYIISLIIATGFFLLFLGLAILNIPQLLGLSHKLESMEWLVVTTAFLLAVYSTSTFNLNRLDAYNQIAWNKIVYVILLNGLSFLLFYQFSNEKGLIYSFVIAYLLIDGFLLIKYFPDTKSFSFGSLKLLMGKYREYPKFTLPSSLMATFINKLPLLGFALFFGESFAGFYLLVDKVLMAPIDLIGRAIGMNYRQEAKTQKVNNGNYLSIFKKTLKMLLVISVPFFLILALFGQEIFELVFGENWRKAGLFAQIMSISFLLKFTAMPLLSGLFVSNKLKENFLLQMIYTISIIISFLVGIYFGDVILCIALFSISGSLYHGYMIARCYALSKNDN